MKALGIILSLVLLLGVTSAWAQSTTNPGPADAARTPGAGGQAPAGTSPSTPAADQPGRGTPSGTAPGGTAPDATAPRSQTPGSTAPGTTAPRAETPGTPTAPSDRTAGGTGRILGLTPLAAGILGLVVVGIIVLLLAGLRRQDRDIVVESRIDARLEDPGARTYESDIERERRRRAS